jgi:hypothetical protein
MTTGMNGARSVTFLSSAFHACLAAAGFGRLHAGHEPVAMIATG